MRAARAGPRGPGGPRRGRTPARLRPRPLPAPGLRAQPSGASSLRGPWTRLFSVGLFVERVLLETEDQAPELRALVTECAFSLDKVRAALPRGVGRGRWARTRWLPRAGRL